MAAGHINRVVGRLRRVALGTPGAARSDARLLERFIACRDPAAFELLLGEHGPMVLGVCRRLLGNEADAEDAFQATFLVLVRKAASIVPREQVGNWLYGVAYRTALKARTMNARRRTRERQAGSRADVAADPAEFRPELLAVLDEELQQMPAKYRCPVVLCDLEGKTHREAAKLLGWPDGTLSTRLVAARRLLADRLTRRGVTLSAGAIAALLTEHAAPAAVPAALAESTVAAVTGSAIATQVSLLTEGVLKAMLIAKLKTAAGVVAGLLLLSAVAGGIAYPGDGPGDDAAQAPVQQTGQVAQPGDAAPQPDLRGKVIRVDEKNLVEISLGTGDGIAKGDPVEIYRLRPRPRYIGRATVIDAGAHSSVVRMKSAGNATAKVGDLVATRLFGEEPQLPSDPLAQDRPQQQPPPAEQLGVVSRIDGANNVLEVSLGSDDGIKEGQILHVWHLTPKATYFGKIKVLATFRRSSVARPSDAAVLKASAAGDKVSVHPPAMPSEPKKAPADPATGADNEPKRPGPKKGGTARQAAERFLDATVAGTFDEERDLRKWPFSKAVLDRLLSSERTPTVALVQVDTDDALAISGPIERPLVVDGVAIGTRVVIQLRRATPGGVPSGWMTGDWIVSAAHLRNAEGALRELEGFLNRHPDARVAPSAAALDAGRK